MAEYKDVEKGESRLERAREKSGLPDNLEPGPRASSAAHEGGTDDADKRDGGHNLPAGAGGQEDVSDVDITSEESDVSDYPETPAAKTKEAAGLFSGKALSNARLFARMKEFCFACRDARTDATTATDRGVSAEDESPVPQYQTYWEKVAGQSQSHAVCVLGLPCQRTQAVRIG